MVTLGRVLLWTVVLVAPGGFLLVPVLAAASLHSRNGSVAALTRAPLPAWPALRDGLGGWFASARSGLQRYWTKS
jgi:hypothetical protein